MPSVSVILERTMNRKCDEISKDDKGVQCSLGVDLSRCSSDIPKSDGFGVASSSSSSSSVLPRRSPRLERITVDAVHPIFELNRKRSVGTSTTEDLDQLYYCDQCKCFIEKSILTVTRHFINYKHRPDNFCVYCQGAVYKYFLNTVELIYHKCDTINSDYDQLDDSETSSECNLLKNNNNLGFEKD